MFQWQKEMDRLGIAGGQVRRLYRSLGDMQVALPGFPSQQATAYLCIYAAETGYRAAVALHLLRSQLLACYLHDRSGVPKQEVGAVLDEGIHFAEAIGFMLGDLDFHLLEPREREDLWKSLPLQNGVVARVEPAKVEPAKVEPAKVEPAKVEPAKVEPAKVEPAKVEPAKVEPAKVEPAKVEPAKVEPAKVEPAKVEPAKVEPAKVEPAKVGLDDLESVSRRAATVRKSPPSPQEMAEKRRKLRENLGRLLVSF